MISYWLHLCCPPVGKPLSAKVDEFRKISEGGRGVICDLKIFIAKYCIRNSCFCQSENREDECRGWLANEAFCLGVCVSGQQLADSFSWISAAAASGRPPNPALNLLHFFTSFLSLTSWREIQVLKHPKKGFFTRILSSNIIGLLITSVETSWFAGKCDGAASIFSLGCKTGWWPLAKKSIHIWLSSSRRESPPLIEGLLCLKDLKLNVSWSLQ